MNTQTLTLDALAQFTGTETWYRHQFSRTITKDRYQNSGAGINQWYGPLEKRPADIDRPSRFITNFSYELPFGPKKKFLKSSNPVLGWGIATVGDWPVGRVLPVLEAAHVLHPGPKSEQRQPV
jgi:hypothetical protein